MVYIRLGLLHYVPTNELVKQAKKGQTAKVLAMAKHHRDHIDDLAEATASGGHIVLVKLLISEGADDFGRMATAAAMAGYTNVLDVILEHYDPEDTDAAYITWVAAEKGYDDIVGFMLKKYPSSHTELFYFMRRGDNRDSVKKMWKYGWNAFIVIGEQVAEAGYLDVVTAALKYEPFEYRNYAKIASKYGHTHIVEMIEKEHGYRIGEEPSTPVF